MNFPLRPGAPFPNQSLPLVPRPSNFGAPNMFGNVPPGGMGGGQQGLLGRLFGKSAMGGGASPGNAMLGANQMMQSGGMPFQRMMGANMPMPQVGGQGGGILSRILGGAGAPGGVPGIGGAGAGGIPGAAAGGMDIAGMLNNVQRVLGVTQQAMPLVQQYGPMVKNIPGLFKMMKALNSGDDDASDESLDETTDEEQEKEEIEVEVKKKSNKKKKVEIDSDEDNEDDDFDDEEEKETDQFAAKGLSRPKLYV